ncbi:MAG: heparan-alpha-glucosaminide N-acetyltransferase [Pseudorhodobacter sp.]
MITGKSSRSPILDLARGVALLGMAIFHFGFDLALFGHVPITAITTGFMPIFARIIAGSFLFLSGISFWLAHGAGFRARPFWRRFGLIVLAALAISLVTRIAMGETWVRFGILHAIAACSLLAVALRKAPAWMLFTLAAIILALPSFLASPAFDSPWLLWLGLAPETPPMMDYEPLLPWLAPFLAGLGLAKMGEGQGWWARILYPGPGRAGLFQWAGRHSLVIYLIHQPVLYSLVWAATKILR